MKMKTFGKTLAAAFVLASFCGFGAGCLGGADSGAEGTTRPTGMADSGAEGTPRPAGRAGSPLPAANGDETETVGLRVNHLVRPSDVSGLPVFSWKMATERPGAAQTAYSLKVVDATLGGAEAAWDSGTVESAESVGIVYGGKPLRPARRYVWSVSVRDERGAWSPVAESSFETGLFGEGAWDGTEWISSPDSPVRTDPRKHGAGKQEAEDGTACFVKPFANAKDVAEAWLTVAGLGVFEAYVNGQPLSGARSCAEPQVLKPGFTDNARTKYSFTFDVTGMVKRGAGETNVLSAEASHGWWSDKIVNFFGVKPGFRARLLLRYSDGTEEAHGTDGTWLSAVAGPVLRAAIFDGEDYDARIGRGWMLGGDAGAFKPAEINREFKGELLPSPGAKVVLRRDIALDPVSAYVWNGVEGASGDAFGTVVKTKEWKRGESVDIGPGDTLIVDFGQNAAAIPSFRFEAAAGVTLEMRPAEMLNDGNGAKSRNCDGPEGSAYFNNYRQARTRLHYTFAGGGVEEYEPRFTFFGYRYASITADGPVRIISAKSVPVTSILSETETGRLYTGVADVNRLVENVRWGQYSNYLSVPTDCPQRNERLGWTADTQVFTRAGSFNADTSAFFTKWTRDLRDSQSPEGSFPGVAPNAQYGKGFCRLGWSDAGVIVPYVVWNQFGERGIVDANWEAMDRYVSLLDELKFEDPRMLGYQWADWLSYEKYESWSHKAFEKKANGKNGPRPEAILYWQYLGCCYWLWDARMMAEMAAATGRDAAKYEAMAGRALAHIRAKFLSDGGMLPECLRDMQTPALFALKLGLFETPEAARKTEAILVGNIAAHGDCLQTGFLGTSILMDTLTRLGRTDVAYSLLLQHKNPSWLYSVDQGATTIWERWNSYTKADGFGSAGMNSFNHYAYGAVLSWMYRTMAGIREGEGGGWRRFRLAPAPDRRVGSVDASFDSPMGRVESAWRYRDDGAWEWKFSIPPNSTAEVTVPGGATETLAAGRYVRVVPGLD